MAYSGHVHVCPLSMCNAAVSMRDLEFLEFFSIKVYISIAIDGSVMGVVEISSPSERCFEVEDLS